MQTGAAGVIFGLNILSIISILLILGSLGVLILWKRKSKYGKGIIGKTGMILHIVCLGIFLYAVTIFQYFYAKPNIITNYIEHILTIPSLLFVIKFGLIIFQLWMGFTILFEKGKQSSQRFMGIIPILSALFLGILISLILAIIMGIIVYFYQSSRKEVPESSRATVKPRPSTGQTLRKPTLDFQTSERESALDIQPAPQEVGSVTCKTATLTVQSADLSKLKEKGPAFSGALAGKTIKLQDRLVFQGIPITVTQIEPSELVTITSETKIKMRSTEEEILLFCSNCGTVQEKIQERCTKCGVSLPVVEL